MLWVFLTRGKSECLSSNLTGIVSMLPACEPPCSFCKYVRCIKNVCKQSKEGKKPTPSSKKTRSSFTTSVSLSTLPAALQKTEQLISTQEPFT